MHYPDRSKCDSEQEYKEWVFEYCYYSADVRAMMSVGSWRDYFPSEVRRFGYEDAAFRGMGGY